MDTLDTELGLPEQTAAPSQQLQKGLVDTRQLGKPEKFSGDPGSFEDWSFVFEAYMSCVDRRYIALFDRVRFSDTPWSNRMMTGVECELSVQLYYTLAMLLQGRALDTCQTAGLGEGFETYRRLVAEYKPRLASRFVGTLMQMLSTRFSTDVEADLPAFEKMVRRYEQETGKTLDDQLKVGIVMNAVTDPGLKDHLIRNAVRLKTYVALKEELLEVARTSRVLNSQPVPMDIGAAPGKGKGKGKDKDKKGSPKGSGKPSTPAPKANPNKNKECHYCHKIGHISADCRKRIKDEAEAKKKKGDKGKGKGGKNRPHAASPAEEEPEPLSATPAEDPAGYVAAVTLEAGRSSEVLVDTGAGSHLFVKGFDPKSRVVGDSGGRGLVTVTREPLTTGPKRQSVVQARDGQSFSIEYNESEKINFSMLSSGQAATKGCWTIIGPNKHCLVLDKNAEKVREALKETACIPLEKKRGVYWLPLKASVKAPNEVQVLAATRAAKKVVPAKARMRQRPGADGPAREGSAGARQ